MSWIQILSYLALGIGVVQAAIIIIDEIQYPQEMMPIMNIVWPLTGLYFPVFGIWAYYGLGRNKGKMSSNSMDMGDMKMESSMERTMEMEHNDEQLDHDHSHHTNHHVHHTKPFWQSVFVSTTHCSSGCSLGDLIGAPIVFVMGWTIAGSTLFADYGVEFMLAYIFGIAFQYYGMGFKKHGQQGQTLIDAVKADTLSLIAFEIGMFGWMAIVHYVLFVNVPQANTAVFWFMMQIAMMIGFCTSYPANWYLVKAGIKHGM